MEIDIFVLRFKICVRGLGFKLRVGFCVFGKWGFCEKFTNLVFEGPTFSHFQDFKFRF